MKIIIKPMGVILLVAAVGGLSALALRKNTSVPSAVANASELTPVSGTQAPGGASAPIRGHAIYRDGIENGWQTAGWTWAKDVDFSETKTKYAGSSAIRVRFTGFEGLKFHHDALNTAPFDRVTFVVYGGAKGGQKLQVSGVCSEKTQGVARTIEPLPAGKWASVTIPLTDLKLANKPDMTAFWIQGNTDKAQADIYVDDVRLLVPGEPASPGAVLASTPQ